MCVTPESAFRTVDLDHTNESMTDPSGQSSVASHGPGKGIVPLSLSVIVKQSQVLVEYYPVVPQGLADRGVCVDRVCVGNFGGRQITARAQHKPHAPGVNHERFEQGFYLRNVFQVAVCIVMPDRNEAE